MSICPYPSDNDESISMHEYFRAVLKWVMSRIDVVLKPTYGNIKYALQIRFIEPPIL